MRRMTSLDRILLLLTVLLASYQVVVGIDGLGNIPVVFYTVAFGILVITGLLLIILGFEVFDSPFVVIVSSILPLSLSLGLVAEFLPQYLLAYIVLAVIGFLVIILTRFFSSQKWGTILIAVFHSMAGLLIFLLPLLFTIEELTSPGFSLVGVGGALIGMMGLLLSFLKVGKPMLSEKTIQAVFPGLLFLSTACFTAGFTFI